MQCISLAKAQLATVKAGGQAQRIALHENSRYRIEHSGLDGCGHASDTPVYLVIDADVAEASPGPGVNKYILLPGRHVELGLCRSLSVRTDRADVLLLVSTAQNL